MVNYQCLIVAVVLILCQLLMDFIFQTRVQVSLVRAHRLSAMEDTLQREVVLLLLMMTWMVTGVLSLVQVMNLVCYTMIKKEDQVVCSL